VKVKPVLGVAVRITAPLKLAVQVVPQLMPAGLLVTVPLPDPARTTVIVLGAPPLAKVAVALAVDPAGMVQVAAVPVHDPLHPVKVNPAFGAAVKVIGPSAKLAVQVVPQLMPAGLLVTVPVPEPANVTVTVLGFGVGVGEPATRPWQPTSSRMAEHIPHARHTLDRTRIPLITSSTFLLGTGFR
jgi:hypothetical protein